MKIHISGLLVARIQSIDYSRAQGKTNDVIIQIQLSKIIYDSSPPLLLISNIYNEHDRNT